MRYASGLSFIFTILFLFLTACAGGDELEPIEGCESNVDCGANETCNLATNTCEPIQAANNSTTPSNATDPDGGNNTQDPDTGMPDMPVDETCEPACADDEVCTNGQCESACPQGCPNDQICTSEGCTFPDCTAAGDPCDAMNGDQGEFLCIGDADGNNGVCRASCEEAQSPSTCETGAYCISVSADEQFKACLPSICESSADCTDGTCIDFENEFSTCVSSGPLAIGDACNVDTGEACVGGAFCRATNDTTGDGVCAAICDPWAAVSTCPAGQACGFFLTQRTGLCTDNLDPQGTSPFEECITPGTACGDGVRCFITSQTVNVCLAYCRPGGASNDCIGILPGGMDGVCNDFAFYDTRDLGLCVGPCSADGDCGPDGRCVDRVCRATCTAATVAADCCAGSPDCNAECINGLCE